MGKIFVTGAATSELAVGIQMVVNEAIKMTKDREKEGLFPKGPHTLYKKLIKHIDVINHHVPLAEKASIYLLTKEHYYFNPSFCRFDERFVLRPFLGSLFDSYMIVRSGVGEWIVVEVTDGTNISSWSTSAPEIVDLQCLVEKELNVKDSTEQDIQEHWEKKGERLGHIWVNVPVKEYMNAVQGTDQINPPKFAEIMKTRTLERLRTLSWAIPQRANIINQYVEAACPPGDWDITVDGPDYLSRSMKALVDMRSNGQKAILKLVCPYYNRMTDRSPLESVRQWDVAPWILVFMLPDEDNKDMGYFYEPLTKSDVFYQGKDSMHTALSNLYCISVQRSTESGELILPGYFRPPFVEIGMPHTDYEFQMKRHNKGIPIITLELTQKEILGKPFDCQYWIDKAVKYLTETSCWDDIDISFVKTDTPIFKINHHNFVYAGFKFYQDSDVNKIKGEVTMLELENKPVEKPAPTPLEETPEMIARPIYATTADSDELSVTIPSSFIEEPSLFGLTDTVQTQLREKPLIIHMADKTEVEPQPTYTAVQELMQKSLLKFYQSVKPKALYGQTHTCGGSYGCLVNKEFEDVCFCIDSMAPCNGKYTVRINMHHTNGKMPFFLRYASQIDDIYKMILDSCRNITRFDPEQETGDDTYMLAVIVPSGALSKPGTENGEAEYLVSFYTIACKDILGKIVTKTGDLFTNVKTYASYRLAIATGIGDLMVNETAIDDKMSEILRGCNPFCDNYGDPMKHLCDYFRYDTMFGAPVMYNRSSINVFKTVGEIIRRIVTEKDFDGCKNYMLHNCGTEDPTILMNCGTEQYIKQIYDTQNHQLYVKVVTNPNMSMSEDSFVAFNKELVTALNEYLTSLNEPDPLKEECDTEFYFEFEYVYSLRENFYEGGIMVKHRRRCNDPECLRDRFVLLPILSNFLDNLGTYAKKVACECNQKCERSTN